jgi:glyoxylase-like metal-dependent hydrolase (beta-lactamase superfamily II)
VTPTLTRVALGYVNAYLVGHPQRWVLIDTGERTHASALREAAARFAGDVPPQAIVLTHGHFDHAGAAAIAALGSADLRQPLRAAVSAWRGGVPPARPGRRWVLRVACPVREHAG